MGVPSAVLDFVQPLQAVELGCGWEVWIGPEASACDCEFEPELGAEVWCLRLGQGEELFGHMDSYTSRQRHGCCRPEADV